MDYLSLIGRTDELSKDDVLRHESVLSSLVSAGQGWTHHHFTQKALMALKFGDFNLCHIGDMLVTRGLLQ